MKKKIGIAAIVAAAVLAVALFLVFTERTNLHKQMRMKSAFRFSWT